jgi:RNA polymerase sigma factor (sigma-70 family)
MAVMNGTQVSDEASVADLVARASDGDKLAWDRIVDRYAPLIWAICRKHRLSEADAEDVGQTVWLILVNQLGKLRDPAALPGWLAVTTRRECFRALRAARRRPMASLSLDIEEIPAAEAPEADQGLLLAERSAALRAAYSGLPPGSQQMIELLIADPPLSYGQISSILGIPVGSIGPVRRRSLEKLRRHPALAALLDADPGS